MMFHKPFLPPSRSVAGLALLAVLTAGGLPNLRAQQPQFSEIVVFGDSLSDIGNIADRVQSETAVRYPGSTFNYTDGRFTNGNDTSPRAPTVTGVWHEQLCATYLHIMVPAASEDGGKDYAFGGAKTIDGSMKRALFTDPAFGQQLSIQIDDMGKQVSDYLAAYTPKPDGLFAVWGGGNDLFDTPDSATVTQTANNVSGLITKLAQAGARYFIVPNVPPLGDVPDYNMNATMSAQLNQASSDYHDLLNTTLDQTVASLASQGITVTIYRLDIYSAFLHFLENPPAWGYQDVTDSSQGQSVDPNRYLFWDGIHPTTYGHAYIAAAAYALISGKPVVVANTAGPKVSDAPGMQAEFFITRVGEDLSTRVKVPFTLGGTAVSGTDYAALEGASRKIRVNKRYQVVDVPLVGNTLTKSSATISLTLDGTANFTPGGRLAAPSLTITK